MQKEMVSNEITTIFIAINEKKTQIDNINNKKKKNNFAIYKCIVMKFDHTIRLWYTRNYDIPAAL